MRIPWARPYIGDEEFAEVHDSLKTKWLSQGPKVARLESLFRDLSGRQYAVAVSNGTLALDLALLTLSVKPGDEVIVPAHTYFATGASVARMGAKPVFADVENDTFTIDPEDVERKITERTVCIICVDLGGNPCDHKALKEVSDRSGAPILSDAAQSLGGELDGESLFTFGHIATTSLHTAKILNAVEAGLIFTDDQTHYELIIRLRNQGEEPGYKFNHTVMGLNARLSDLHAAVGVAQMKKYDNIVRKREYIAGKYEEALSGVNGLKIVRTRKNGKNGWFFFSILAESRDRLAGYLADEGIETRICYPVPLYRQKAFSGIPFTECPNAEEITSRIITLPMYYEMTDDEIDYVVDKIISFYEGE